jgi:hypothetical protein
MALNFRRRARASFDFEVEEIQQDLRPSLACLRRTVGDADSSRIREQIYETENLTGGAFEILSL